jgi:hypothetical protein
LRRDHSEGFAKSVTQDSLISDLEDRREVRKRPWHQNGLSLEFPIVPASCIFFIDISDTTWDSKQKHVGMEARWRAILVHR